MSRRRFYDLIVLAGLLVFLGSLVMHRLLLGLPDIRSLETYSPALTTHIYDRRGEAIAEFSIEKRSLIPLSKIPVDLQNAVIAVEDSRFFEHFGISPKGIARSALINLMAGHVVQGASTITQQLAKQIFLTPARTLARKIREALLAIQLERNYSKGEILGFYLNQVYFGRGAYGVKAAAHAYFGKEIQDLTLQDCALLAGLIRSPRRYSPFFHPDRAMARRAIVLDRMLEVGLITRKQKEEAQAAPLPTPPLAATPSLAPYFVEYVKRDIEKRYGYNALWRGGLKIYTTLDLSAQKEADAGFDAGLADFDKKALEYWQTHQAEDQNVIGVFSSTSTPPPPVQGAFLILDVKTGAIRAMIGGRNSIFNRAVQAKRQPGSTFKPFVWAASLHSGMTAASLVDDSPLAYYYDGADWRLLKGATDLYAINMATAPFALSPEFKIWVPNDFDNKFLGIITLRKAISKSRNIASVRLIERVGPPVAVDIAHKAGIASDLAPVISLGLGSSVVTPIEIANAFATFANGGIREEPYAIERVEDSSGKELESRLPRETEALSPQLSYLVTNLLKGVVSNGTGIYARRLRRPLAGKTGTSNGNRDLWFIGYTPDLVACAWMGYDDFSTLPRRRWTAATTVLPWWTQIMAGVLKDYPKRDFPAPNGIVFRTIDGISGYPPLPTCPRSALVLEAFKEGTAPSEYCPLDHSKPLPPQLSAILKKQWPSAQSIESYPVDVSTVDVSTVSVSTPVPSQEASPDDLPSPEPE